MSASKPKLSTFLFPLGQVIQRKTRAEETMAKMSAMGYSPAEVEEYLDTMANLAASGMAPYQLNMIANAFARGDATDPKGNK